MQPMYKAYYSHLQVDDDVCRIESEEGQSFLPPFFSPLSLASI